MPGIGQARGGIGAQAPVKLSLYAVYTALVLQVALIAGLGVWCGPVPGLLLALPLAAPLPGLWRRRTYTAGWASMVVAFYVAGLMAEGVAQPERRLIGGGLSVVAALDFAAMLLFVRFSAREQAAPAARSGSSGGDRSSIARSRGLWGRRPGRRSFRGRRLQGLRR